MAVMGAIDILAGAGFAIGSTLTAFGPILMAAPYNRPQPAKACFVLSALIFAGVGLMWGINTGTRWPLRFAICGGFGAVALIGAVEGMRLVLHPKAEAATMPSSQNPQNTKIEINAPTNGQIGGTINNNGPTYNGPTSVHNHTTVVHRNENEGVLFPANVTHTQSLGIIEKLPPKFRPPEHALKVLLGTNLAWGTQMPHTVLMMGGDPMIQIDRTEHGDAVVVTILRIFDDRDNIIARIDKDGFWIENSTRKKRPDKSTLSVYDHLGNEVLKIEYLRKDLISITGTFRHPGMKVPVVITADHMMINGATLRESVVGDNGGADISVGH